MGAVSKKYETVFELIYRFNLCGICSKSRSWFRRVLPDNVRSRIEFVHNFLSSAVYSENRAAQRETLHVHVCAPINKFNKCPGTDCISVIRFSLCAGSAVLVGAEYPALPLRFPINYRPFLHRRTRPSYVLVVYVDDQPTKIKHNKKQRNDEKPWLPLFKLWRSCGRCSKSWNKLPIKGLCVLGKSLKHINYWRVLCAQPNNFQFISTVLQGF